uniref:Zgc:193812 n=1 Tax=Oryzias latipes TaxID=8090 RepID=A0A3P9KYM9_ORYLA
MFTNELTASMLTGSLIRRSEAQSRFTRTRLLGTTTWERRCFSGGGQNMPRKEIKGKPVAAAGSATAQTRAAGPVAADKSGAVTVSVHVKPGSKQSAITDVSAEAVGVSIGAPPTDGEANTELIRYLADVLDLKKSQISLSKGSRSRDKLIRVDSSLSQEEVLRRLQEAVG